MTDEKRHQKQGYGSGKPCQRFIMRIPALADVAFYDTARPLGTVRPSRGVRSRPRGRDDLVRTGRSSIVSTVVFVCEDRRDASHDENRVGREA